MLTALCDKWPDFFEVHQQSEDSPPHILFVCQRKNSRQFQSDQLAALRWLEKIFENTPHRVVVRVANVNLSLDDFERGGSYGLNAGPIRPLAQSTYYAKQAELRRIERVIEEMTVTDPQRELLVARYETVRKQLGTSDDAMVSQEAVRRSDDALNKLILLFKDNPAAPLEELNGASMEWKTIGEIKDERMRKKLTADKQIQLLTKELEGCAPQYVGEYQVKIKGYEKVVAAYKTVAPLEEIQKLYNAAVMAKETQNAQQSVAHDPGHSPTEASPEFRASDPAPDQSEDDLTRR